METVVFLSGSTRGATLEGVGRSLGQAFRDAGFEFLELRLTDPQAILEKLRGMNFDKVRCVFSWVSMGIDFSLKREDGTTFELWHELGLPFISIHGDSPAYFFDRHVVRDSKYVSMYSFTEHRDLRRRLPNVHGPLATSWPTLLDRIAKEQVDFKAKKQGKLIFLKNGKNPFHLRGFWASTLEQPLLRIILNLADELEARLDDPICIQIDDLVTRRCADHDIDIENLTRLRLFLIAQLDDYLRAVKCTRMAQALMEFPVEIRGNNWDHLDFSGKKAVCIDECDYVKSIGHVRDSFGMIDMSPNTASRPHDRVVRAYGAYTFCLTNEQTFLRDLPHQEALSFGFDKESLQSRVAHLLAHRDSAIEMGIEVAEEYDRQHPAEQAVTHMLELASLARFDGRHNRPAGSQDFFVWPTKL